VPSALGLCEHKIPEQYCRRKMQEVFVFKKRQGVLLSFEFILTGFETVAGEEKRPQLFGAAYISLQNSVLNVF